MDQEPALELAGTGQETAPVRRQVDAHAGDGGDGDPRWRVTLPVMWVAQLCAIMGFSFVMPFIPFFVRELGVSAPMLPIYAGLTITGSGIAMGVMSPVWGHIADRRGRKLMVQRAMFGGGVIVASMGLVRNVYELLALRIVQGAVTGTVAACVTLVSSVVPRDRLGFSLGIMQMAVFTGGSIGPYLGGIMADHYGYRLPFAVTGGLLFAGGVLVLFGAKERFTAPDPQDRTAVPPLRVLLRNPTVLGILGVFFVMNLSTSFVGPIFPLFVEEIARRPEKAASETGVLLAVTGIASAVSAVVVGRVSDRVGHKLMLVSCAVLTGLVSFPNFWARDLTQLLLLRAAHGLAAGGTMPAMNAIVASVVPRSSIGRAYGFTATASALGMAVGPAMGGVTAAAFGYRWPFIIMGVLMLLVALAQQRWVSTDSSRQELLSVGANSADREL